TGPRSPSQPWGALLLLPLLLPAACRAGSGCVGEGGPLEPFDALYATGVQAYYGGDFAGAARCLERALRSRRELRDTRLRCRRLCLGQVRLAAPGPGAGGDLPFFSSVLGRAGCVRRCEEPRLGAASRHRAAEEVRADFQRRVPYSYLQRAYIQVGTARPPRQAVTFPEENSVILSTSLPKRINTPPPKTTTKFAPNQDS
uniref:Leprecan-like alpha-helical domain-containing protein n=1 Tax=Melopsittacus undulatus TaxID=13146 RepID=A0A8V5GMU5_MELUD